MIPIASILFINSLKTFSLQNIGDQAPCHPLDLITANLENFPLSSTRYLLVMTEDFSALPILQQRFLQNEEDVVVIFGSSFPKDQEFTQVRHLSYLMSLTSLNKIVCDVDIQGFFQQ